MFKAKLSLRRRKVLGLTAGAIVGSGLTAKSVTADSEEVAEKDAPFAEATLTYSGDLDDAIGFEAECGEPNHIIHDSDVYVGNIDIRPYMEKSPLALLNSKLQPKEKPSPTFLQTHFQ